MARKSSFLQGFEVGSDLYNKGFSQAATMRQMSMQEARDKAAAERHAAEEKRAERLDKLAEDRHDLFKQKFEWEKEANDRARAEREKEKEKERAALNGFMRMRTMYNDQPSEEAKVDFFMRNRGEIEASLAGTKHWRAYEVWRQSEVYDNATYKLTSQLKALRAEEGMQGARAELTRAENAKLIAKQYQAITGENLNPFDPNEVARAQTVIWDADVRGFAVQQGVTLPADYQIGDFNKDGKLDSRDLTAAKSDVLRMKSDLAKTQNEAKRKRDLQYEKWKLDYASEIKMREADHKAAMERVGKLAPNSPQWRSEVRRIALSGDTYQDLKAMGYDESITQAVHAYQSNIKNRLQHDKTLTPVEAVAMSAIFSKEPELDVIKQINKGFQARAQIQTFGQWFGANGQKLGTGPIRGQINQLSKYWSSDDSENIAAMEGLLNALIPNLAKGIYGEVGVLTDSDIKNYKKTFVSLDNPDAINKLLFKVTQDMVNRSISEQLETAARGGRNVSGFVPRLSEVTGDPIPFLYGEDPNAGRPGASDGKVIGPDGTEFRPELKSDPIKLNEGDQYSSPQAAFTKAVMYAMHTGNFSPVKLNVNGTMQQFAPSSEEGIKLAKSLFQSKDGALGARWTDDGGEIRPWVHPNALQRIMNLSTQTLDADGNEIEPAAPVPAEKEEAEPKPQAKDDEPSWETRSQAAYELANPYKYGGHFREQQHRKIEGYNNPIKFSLDMKKDGVIISEILPDGESKTRLMPWREFNELIPLNRETSWLLEEQ